jgi:hypothetical protein
MSRSVLKIIVKIRMIYCNIRGHHGKNGTMNHQKITWVEKEKNEYR